MTQSNVFLFTYMRCIFYLNAFQLLKLWIPQNKGGGGGGGGGSTKCPWQLALADFIIQGNVS